MPIPPQLSPLKEQQLYSNLHPDVQTPNPISKSEAKYPTQETHISLFYPQSYSFSR